MENNQPQHNKGDHHRLQEASHDVRTLPGMRTAAGPIYVGTTPALSIPLPIALMLAREFSYRSLDQHYPAQSSAARRVSGNDAEATHTQLAAALIASFAVLNRSAQFQFYAELLKFIAFYQDATGLEGLLITCLQTVWLSDDLNAMDMGIRLWERFGRRGRHAAFKVVYAFDEPSRKLKAFVPGEVAGLRTDEAINDLLRIALKKRGVDPREALARLNQDATNPATDIFGVGFNGVFPGVGGNIPDLGRGPGGPGSAWGDLPGGKGSGGSGVGGNIPDLGRGPGGSGSAWGDIPGGKGSGGSGVGGDIPDLGRGPGGSGSAWGDIPGGKSNTGSFGNYVPDIGSKRGPFTGSFQDPGLAGSPEDNSRKSAGQTLQQIGTAMITLGCGYILVITGAGAAVGAGTGGPPGAAAGGSAAAIGAAPTGGIVAAVGAFVYFVGKEVESAADANIKKEDAGKSTPKPADPKPTDPTPTDPKPKSQSPTGDEYPDPYGGGGNPKFTNQLDRIPVGDGSGGVGPTMLGSLPVGDGSGGVGPSMLASLPVDGDDGPNPPRPNLVRKATLTTVGGSGLSSLVLQGNARTVVVLGLPKMGANGTIEDVGMLGMLLA